ncbi:CPBP family intramembrane glutamic endopeptidase [Dyella acidiphila]|uniref:CPBP family intramembrane metalloprotease n=1 Tax=Dyella acidiphila TaxID=2775866 RepID=A0ABR9G7N0_9GAMM|nr:type II CAAX endopeptidase family protein [Dyella acidiphila]MBE1160041.1 CPBP family intramembrane metalloprotease [Dyella acidiphila]
MAAWPIKPAATPSPPEAPRAPGVLYALALIAIYFLLQLIASALISFTLSLVARVRHPELSQAQVHARVMELLQRPDSNALLVIVVLPLIALLMLWFVRRHWPLLWTGRRPPGFGWSAPSSANWYLVALLIGLAMPPIGAVLTQLLAHGHQVTQNVEELSRQVSGSLRLPLGIVAVTVGPMIEELMFRGVLLSALMHRLSMLWSVVLCSCLFGAVHLAGLDFQWYAVPNLILLAAVLCWLRLKSASLWPAVIAHGVYNLFALIALFAAT